MKKQWIALKIELIWMEIRHLRRKLKKSKDFTIIDRINLAICRKRLEEEQLRVLYEVYAGIRNGYGQIL